MYPKTDKATGCWESTTLKPVNHSLRDIKAQFGWKDKKPELDPGHGQINHRLGRDTFKHVLTPALYHRFKPFNCALETIPSQCRLEFARWGGVRAITHREHAPYLQVTTRGCLFITTPQFNLHLCTCNHRHQGEFWSHWKCISEERIRLESLIRWNVHANHTLSRSTVKTHLLLSSTVPSTLCFELVLWIFC